MENILPIYYGTLFGFFMIGVAVGYKIGTKKTK